jgi:hypothetical protein
LTGRIQFGGGAISASKGSLVLSDVLFDSNTAPRVRFVKQSFGLEKKVALIVKEFLNNDIFTIIRVLQGSAIEASYANVTSNLLTVENNTAKWVSVLLVFFLLALALVGASC